MKKAVFFDFDGVIVKNTLCTKIVGNRANSFVKRTMNLSNKSASIMNKHLYTTYGHTVSGLREIGFNVSMTDFNNYVYNINYYDIFKNIDLKNDIQDINKIIILAKERNITLFMNSNCPDIWLYGILNQMKVDVNNFKIIDNSMNLKPSFQNYLEVNKFAQNFDKVYFVDDSFVNFKFTIHDPKWFNILFDKKKINLPLKNIKVIDSLEDLDQILSYEEEKTKLIKYTNNHPLWNNKFL